MCIEILVHILLCYSPLVANTSIVDFLEDSSPKSPVTCGVGSKTIHTVTRSLYEHITSVFR